MFSMCCMEGKVKSPTLKECSPYLDQLLNYKGGLKSAPFRDHIREYNSMFTFASIRAKVDKDINKEPDAYVLKISGESYHRIGSLIHPPNENPKFVQPYIYDIEYEA